MCLQLGFSKISTDEILLALTEMLTNVTKYANNKARILARPWTLDERLIGIEIIVTDQGPGIKNLSEALKDGYTTTKSLGLGLGAIKRLSDELEIYTLTEKKSESHVNLMKRSVVRDKHSHLKGKTGTTIIFRRKLGSRTRFQQDELGTKYHAFSTHPKLVISGRTRARNGSLHNGDGIYWNEQKKVAFISILDGLGHGLNARLATQQAINILRKRHELPLTTLMKVLHQQLKITNGCQGMLLRINKVTKTCTYLGVGNIRGFFIKRNHIKPLLTKDGVLGKALPTLNETTIGFPPPSLMILHTDGISREWINDARKLNLLRYKASDIVNDLITLHHKSIDDGAVVVIQNVEY